MCGDIEKLEKVIKALENCNAPEKCRDCPWKPCEEPDCKHSDYPDGLIEQAIALLKAQAPRVFNVGDFYGEEFGYLEYRPDRPGFSNFDPSPILIGDIDEENVTVIFRSASVLKLPLDMMNKNWRIWSDYPTHEQLRTAEWE